VIDALLADLARASFGGAFNQYRDTSEEDVPGAPSIRLANLRTYLEQRSAADVVALGEAAGYQGMRWSGIAFTSERDLLRWGPPFATTCAARCWSEPSGTIVHRVLEELGAERRVILWNTVPAHPRRPGLPHSNRRPTGEEVAAGAPFVERLLELVRPRTVVAVGRVAEAVLGERARYVRHPANAGGPAFAAGMRAILAGR
jgi:uracil-DNA glycosylase